MLTEHWATVYSTERYISSRATPLATKSPRLTLTARESILDVRICRHQIMTSEDDPRTEGIKIFILGL